MVLLVGGMGGLEVEGRGTVFTPWGAVILGGDGWMVCHIVLRRAETVFKETPPSGRPSRWKRSPPSRHRGDDQQPSATINTHFFQENKQVLVRFHWRMQNVNFSREIPRISVQKVVHPSLIGITSALKCHQVS